MKTIMFMVTNQLSNSIIHYEEYAKIYISEKILINYFSIFMKGKGYLFYDKLNIVNYNCERFSSISLGRPNGWE